MNTALSVRLSGPRDGKAIVFFHGFMGRGDDFLPVIALLDTRYRCISFDLPGHGLSLYRERPLLESVSGFPELSGMILRDITLLGIKRFSLYGYSMGGRIAQAAALAAPDRIDRLFLESSSFGIDGEEERTRRYRDDSAMLKGIETADDFRDFLERWYSLPLFRTLHAGEARERMISSRMKNDVKELHRSLLLLSPGNHPPLLEDLARARLPVTYLCGAMDEKYMAEAERGKRAIPGLEVIRFRDASHNIHSEFPGPVADGIMRALGD